ncbi:hypothetical protein [Phaeobacter sp. HF9A]|uniref:hypothetical protein n=1 Tax=Phaeobacter sp. HF9A TaxID=2721561 RepID=UPI0034C6843D
MILRRLIGRAVNASVDAGINAFSRRGGKGRAQPSPEEQAERERIREIRQARRARRAEQDQNQ